MVGVWWGCGGCVVGRVAGAWGVGGLGATGGPWQVLAGRALRSEGLVGATRKGEERVKGGREKVGYWGGWDLD